MEEAVDEMKPLETPVDNGAVAEVDAPVERGAVAEVPNSEVVELT